MPDQPPIVLTPEAVPRATVTHPCARGVNRCAGRVTRYGTYCSQVCRRIAQHLERACAKPDGPVTLGGSANVHQAFSWLDVRAGEAS